MVDPTERAAIMAYVNQRFAQTEAHLVALSQDPALSAAQRNQVKRSLFYWRTGHYPTKKQRKSGR